MTDNTHIRIRGATQNNLKNLDLDLPLGELTVVTGVSGSGKSSLAFDTVYSEGQRRYVETFSPYARQFLDRMDKPAADHIDGIPPAIAIDQTNPVRTSRSTVGTMTELNDHLKLLFARVTLAWCPRCANPVRRDDAHAIAADLISAKTTPERIEVQFAVTVPDNFTEDEVRKILDRQGYTRVHGKAPNLQVVQARMRPTHSRRPQLIEALEAALGRGQGHITVADSDDEKGWRRRFSADLHCADCDRSFKTPIPSLFSFNSPAGACAACRGFGRTVGIDYALVIPDPKLSLAEGTVKPFQSKSYTKCQRDLMRHAKTKGIPTDVPWGELDDEAQSWVLKGEGSIRSKRWYGINKFFDWLETKAYRMHIRVLLSRYRSYEPCNTCHGARLVPEALDWRLGDDAAADAVLPRTARSAAHHRDITPADPANLPGLNIHDVMCLPLDLARQYFDALELPAPLDEATRQLLGEIRSRLAYLTDVGLGYLTLDRQSRTLSGGEVQRINLTTALGTSLVNTLFVLDEPSIGLHSRDMSRVTGVLTRLRDAGNTLLVVEHDSAVMLSADKIIDMGPGPGERGGEIVFHGTPKALLKKRGSLTGEYLSGKRSVAPPPAAQSANAVREDAGTHWLTVHGARHNNLTGVDAAFPLGQMVCVTGVSGSGKSTLVHDVLYQGIRKLKGRPDETPGLHDAISGADLIEDVLMVDQSPIGKTTRSNPASYVGALDSIRKLFAADDVARERGYKPGMFSFNSGNGRCPACSGNGFEHVEMQFLSDVYLRCPDCDGRRYRDEVLEIKLLPGIGSDSSAASIADVLDMTVVQALEFFEAHRDVHAALAPLAAVGLDYLKLGQPVPTLSGGEAQRLKLAGHLAKHAGKKHSKLSTRPTLFLFDEPTTGLHFHDIARLLTAFAALIDAGHTLIIIEHNLDVIRHSDWVIDLGPEGGSGGGQLVAYGPPGVVAQTSKGFTADALNGAFDPDPSTAGSTKKRKRAANTIEVHNAREHNLKSVDVTIPRGELTVITGVSGSGKSTVAFDILFGEGQRRYLESLNAYARQFVQPAARPEVDSIVGIPPTVAIEQRTSRGGRKSTVGTVTEVHHFVRLLYVKLGTQHCPDCDVPIDVQDIDSIVASIMRGQRGRNITAFSPLVVARKGYYTDLARWAGARGHAHLRVDGKLLPTDNWPRLDRFNEHDIDLPVGSIKVSAKAEAALRTLLEDTLGLGKGLARVGATQDDEALYSTERACPSCSRSFAPLDPRLFSYNSRHGWCDGCFGTGLRIKSFDAEQTGEEAAWTDLGDDEPVTCKQCDGGRLNSQALAVRFQDQPIAAVSALTVDQAFALFNALKLKGRDELIARDIVREVSARLSFLQKVGLGYLSLDRGAPTLSGGEAQRIRLAAQLGSNLRGVCYILDEPTIGLHPSDNRMLLDTLVGLREKGNTVVVVEHDEETIRRAEHIVDLGPGAGRFGGEVVATGTLEEIQQAPRSVTGQMLRMPLAHPMNVDRTRVTDAGVLEVQKATANNLRNVSVKFPLARLVAVTGVSGSGKSTLVREVLLRNLAERAGKKVAPRKAWHGCDSIEGADVVARVLEVDQTPIGKTPRSCPATYLGIWDYIRKLYAGTEEARLRGYSPARFSFNVSGGRCDTCDGQGMQRIEMNFLPDVRVPCERCNGERFNAETMSVTYKDASIADVLTMRIDEAVDFFEAHPKVHYALTLLRDVGLGYLSLGQPSPTLSGGEAQRIKLVTELARARPLDDGPGARRGGRAAHTLFVLDEPTTGLHMADVEKLTKVLHRLVDAGHSVVVIEHNLDVIAEADHVIDLGPGGGDGGGRLVAQGTPAQLAKRKRATPTGLELREFLNSRVRH
jgi:excinuclease ABC subunit A